MGDAKKPHPLGFVFTDGKVTGPLPVGMKVEGVVHNNFVMRDAEVGDLLDAELEADAFKPLTFSAHLLALQLVSVGTYTGPFTVGMLRRLKQADWRILRAAQGELDKAGEAAPAGKPAS